MNAAPSVLSPCSKTKTNLPCLIVGLFFDPVQLPFGFPGLYAFPFVVVFFTLGQGNFQFGQTAFVDKEVQRYAGIPADLNGLMEFLQLLFF